MRGIRIYSCTKSSVADFAVEELQKYLNNITEGPVDVISWASPQEKSNSVSDETQMQKGIWIGTVGDLSVVPWDVNIRITMLSSVQDPWFDDAIGIQIDQGAGVNPAGGAHGYVPVGRIPTQGMRGGLPPCDWFQHG
jgi:hypothetical protein